MDATIMALDSLDPTATPLSLPALVPFSYPLEIALAWVHLPSGGAAVQGIVRHPDGGPIVGGSRLRNRPVGAGGTEILLPGADPHGHASHHLLRPDQWAMATPAMVEPTLTERGWQLTSRTDAIHTLTYQGYQIRDSSQPGHVVHLDQDDDAVWHDWTVAGKAFPYVQAAFVTRRMPHLAVVPTISDTAADTGSDGESGEQTSRST